MVLFVLFVIFVSLMVNLLLSSLFVWVWFIFVKVGVVVIEEVNRVLVKIFNLNEGFIFIFLLFFYNLEWGWCVDGIVILVS